MVRNVIWHQISLTYILKGTATEMNGIMSTVSVALSLRNEPNVRTYAWNGERTTLNLCYVMGCVCGVPISQLFQKYAEVAFLSIAKNYAQLQVAWTMFLRQFSKIWKSMLLCQQVIVPLPRKTSSSWTLYLLTDEYISHIIIITETANNKTTTN